MKASEVLTQNPSAQTADVVALLEALNWAAGKMVTVYSDLAYAVGAAHLELGLETTLPDVTLEVIIQAQEEIED